MSPHDNSLKVKKDAAVSALYSLSRASTEATNALIDLVNHLESSGTEAGDLRAAFAAIGFPAAASAPTPAPAPEPTPRRRRAAAKPSENSAKSKETVNSPAENSANSEPAKSPRATRGRKPASTTPEPDSAPHLSPPTSPTGSPSQIQPVVVPRAISQIQDLPNSGEHTANSAESEEADDGKKPAKRKPRARAPKDPNAPKRPLSAFLKFRNQVISDLTADNKARGLPGASLEEINAAVAQRWDELPESERERRKEEFAQLNLAFYKERDLYNAKQKADSDLGNDKSGEESLESNAETLASEQSQGTQTELASQSTQPDDLEAPPRKRHRKEKSKPKEKAKSKE